MARTDPDKAVSDVGRRIAELREDRGWTQAEAATHANVSIKYVQKVEGGSANLSIHSLVKFANALRVPLADLFVKPSRGRKGPGRPRTVK